VRVAVSGAGGRLGHALIAALEEAPFVGPFGPIPWTRPAFDVDDPTRFAALLDRDRPEVVVHAAAWTDVDGCARDPELALARNGTATGALAGAAAERGIDLVVLSTNEVFDGLLGDAERRGYRPDDPPNPINAYGRSKLAGERLAAEAFGGAAARLGIVRTAWLFGPPGNDFPEKILRAADAARADGSPLRLVADETGSPTYAPDLAGAIVELIGADAIAGIRHVVNGGSATRAAWAREVLRQAGVDVATQDVRSVDFPRASTPPRWAVLDPTPLPDGEPLRPWQAAVADDLPAVLRRRAAAVR
jgi:dTDP-4-dehydrorhamnose reductase